MPENEVQKAVETVRKELTSLQKSRAKKDGTPPPPEPGNPVREWQKRQGYR